MYGERPVKIFTYAVNVWRSGSRRDNHPGRSEKIDPGGSQRRFKRLSATLIEYSSYDTRRDNDESALPL
jgi:hypothetical protein